MMYCDVKLEVSHLIEASKAIMMGCENEDDADDDDVHAHVSRRTFRGLQRRRSRCSCRRVESKKAIKMYKQKNIFDTFYEALSKRKQAVNLLFAHQSIKRVFP